MRIFNIIGFFRDWVALIVALIVSVALMGASGHSMAETFRHSINRPIEFIASPITTIARSFDIWKENRELRGELVRMSMERAQYRDVLLENIRLRRLLGFRDRPEFEYLAAEVVMRDPNPTLSSLTLNKGSDQGIHVGQAVVTPNGLAGLIHQTGPASSTVLLATDRNFAVSARVERTRVDGVIRWAGGGSMTLTEVPRNLDVLEGDRIVTSGLGGMIPSGIPVGVVERVDRSSTLFLSITVRPFVKHHRLEEVFVLLPLVDYLPELRETLGGRP